MDLALTINGWIDEEVIFAQMLGARHVFAQVDSSMSGAMGWDAPALARLANRIEKGGLALAGLHISGAPGESPAAALDWAARLACEAGAAKMSLLSLSPALFAARRAGAPASPAHLAALSEAAAQAGVQLAIPAAALQVRSGRGAKPRPERLLQSLPAAAGLDGTPGVLLAWLQNSAPDADVQMLLQNRLLLVSFDQQARPGADELLPACWRLRQAGYTGLIRLARSSQWKGDTQEGYYARAFSTGYFRAMLQAFARG